ncbi:MAG: NADPH-dependent reductase [Sporomusa sp.]|jgi:multimeric flavodoxin WrbA|nr:NADPH-dependent reductase [Sporomusa sp.]
MRVLGLVASPRRVGNSEIIVKEMMNVLPNDWDKGMVSLNNLRIDRCKACYACLPQEKRCILKDDLNFFLDCIREADKVIIAAPVYFLGQHTILKLINDRLISILNNGAEYFAGKQCVIAVPYGIKDWEGYAREATMNFARFLGLNVTGTMIINATLPGDVVDQATLSAIRKLAKSLEDNSVVDFNDPGKVYCPDCGSSLLQICHNSKWHCVFCDAGGEWSVADRQFVLTWNLEDHRRFSQAGMIAHGHALTQAKDKFISSRKQVAAIQGQYKEPDLWIKPDQS